MRGVPLLREVQLRLARGAVQRALYAVADAIKDVALVDKFDLRLGRMDVHVDQMLRQRQAQHARRIAADHEPVAVRLLQRGGHRLGADVAPVDEKKLICAVAARGVRPRNEARQGVFVPVAVHGDQVLGGLTAQHGADRAEKLAVTDGRKLFLAVAQDADRRLRMRQRQPLHGRQQRRGLHRVTFHEFQACGRVIEQVAHDDRRSVRAADLAALGHDARLEMQARAEGRVGGLGHQVDARHGRDRRQRLAAEAQRVDGLQVLGGAELARRMAQKGRFGVVGRHAAAVVRDAQEGHAAVLQLDRDVLGPGVNGVLDQLLGGACRALHDLTGGDQVRHMRR